MVLLLLAFLVMSPLPVLAALGGVTFVRNRFQAPPAAPERKRSGRRIYSSLPAQVANGNTRAASRRAA